MKRKKAALYDPYLNVLGGGERHILSIFEVLSNHDYEVDVFWEEDLKEKISDKLRIQIPMNFVKGFTKKPIFEKQDLLRLYDIFITATDGSYSFASAKKNYIFCMVPQKDLYKMNYLNKIKTLNYKFISNSKYTQFWLEKWGIKSEVIYPYINKDFFQYAQQMRKEKTIISVGRFFPHLHTKRHDIIIKWFLELKKTIPSYKSWKLELAGMLKDEDMEYFNSLKKLSEGDPSIIFHPNASYFQILELYRKADIYWHMAGYGVDENKTPEKVEHLGITPLEAMAGGCIVMGYNAGGLREIISSQKTGYLFLEKEELFNWMKSINNDEDKKTQVRYDSFAFVNETFSYEVFENRVLEVLHVV